MTEASTRHGRSNFPRSDEHASVELAVREHWVYRRAAGGNTQDGEAMNMRACRGPSAA